MRSRWGSDGGRRRGGRPSRCRGARGKLGPAGLLAARTESRLRTASRTVARGSIAGALDEVLRPLACESGREPIQRTPAPTRGTPTPLPPGRAWARLTTPTGTTTAEPAPRFHGSGAAHHQQPAVAHHHHDQAAHDPDRHGDQASALALCVQALLSRPARRGNVEQIDYRPTPGEHMTTSRGGLVLRRQALPRPRPRQRGTRPAAGAHRRDPTGVGVTTYISGSAIRSVFDPDVEERVGEDAGVGVGDPYMRPAKAFVSALLEVADSCSDAVNPPDARQGRHSGRDRVLWGEGEVADAVTAQAGELSEVRLGDVAAAGGVDEACSPLMSA